MRKIILIIILFIKTSTLLAQNTTDSNLVFNNSSYSYYMIKIDSSNLSKISLINNAGKLNHKDFIEEYTTNHDPDFFAINASVNDKSGNPIGLFISNNQELNKLNTDDGVGNFFLKPNGVLVITIDNAFIVKSEKFKTQRGIINAVQSGPMLVIDDSIHSSFNPNSTNKNLRCGVGIFNKINSNYLIFTISKDPVSFYEFASMYKDYFHCHNALCLESGNSVMYTPNNSDPLAINKVVGSYLIYEPDNNSNQSKPLSKSNNVIQMIKSSSGIYELPVELNKVLKISFIFDPGAADVSISPDVAYTLIRTGTITDKDYIGTQKYSFADGSTAVSSVFNLHEIKIGSFTIKNVRVSIANSLKAPMLLGQSVLQRMGKFTIYNTNHTLTIN